MDNGQLSYRRYLDGDEDAFTELVQEYRASVTFFICGIVHDAAAAEDLAIDVFMQLVVHPHRYNFKYSLKTYLFMLARSRAIDFLRKEKRHPSVSIDDDEAGLAEKLADEQSLEDTVLQNEQVRALHAAIGMLPPDQQTAVHLVYFEDQSYAETARIMKKTAKQVDNLLSSAKQKLRNLLGEEGKKR